MNKEAIGKSHAKVIFLGEHSIGYFTEKVS